MSENLDIRKVEQAGLRKVWRVSDFVKRYRLSNVEEKRLTTLFGAFASEQELLSNATRAPMYR
jgi:uncharacterized membrane protein